jgi:hypothetical protein
VILFRVYSVDAIDPAPALAAAPEDARDALEVNERTLAAPPGYPPGTVEGKEPVIDRHARSKYVYDISRRVTVGADAAALAVAGAGVAARLAREAEGLVLDPSAGILLTPDEAGSIEAAAALPVERLVRVHFIEGPDGLWAHTHGAVKLGLPEVEAFGVDPRRAPDLTRFFTDLLGHWVKSGVAGAGVEVDLPRGKARTVVPARGAARPRWARCGEEPSRWLLLVDSEDGGDISRSLGEEPLSEHDFILSEAEMRAEAQGLLAALRPHLGGGRRLPEGVRVLANLVVERKDGTVDLGWCAVDRLEGETLSGEIAAGERIDFAADAVLAVRVFRHGIPLGSGEVSKLVGVAASPSSSSSPAP